MGVYNIEGFKAISWDSVKHGQEVYIKGTATGTQVAYGPHYVHDKTKRTLRNAKGRIFFEPLEMLLTAI